MKQRRTAGLAALASLVLTGLAVGSGAGTTQAAAVPVPPKIGFWAGESFTPCPALEITSCPRDLTNYTDAVWDVLEAGDAFLGMDLIYGSDFGPNQPGVNRRTDAVPLIQEANARGIEIDAWITLPVGRGTFSNENNAQATQDAVKAFDAWADANGLQFGDITLDLEFPLGYQAVQDALVSGDTSGLKEILSGNLNPSHQCASIAKYKQTITWAHNNGWRVTGAPILFAIDDLEDGNLALADLFDMATPLPQYDQMYVQAYRAFGLDLGSGLVASYYDDMQEQFGAKGQVTLGNTGIPPYNTAAPLIADIRMLTAMGATKIPIFDFDNAVKTYGVTGLAQVIGARNNPMNASELAAAKVMSPTGIAARAMFRGLDNYATWSTPFLSWQVPNSWPTSC